MSFSFIDEKNKILDIDTTQNYYLAGKNKDVLFISKTFNISDGIITFDVDTYTEPFLNEVQKRNTEIQIELGYNTAGVQKVLLRDYAFAQPRVYIEGLNPSKVNFADYYTKGEVDSLLSNINIDTSMFYTKEEVNDLIPEIPAVPTKLSDLQNDSGFITDYNETDPIFSAVSGTFATKDYVTEVLGNNEAGGNNTGRIFSDPKFLYLNSCQQVSYTDKWARYTGVLGEDPPSSEIRISRGFNNVPSQECFFEMVLTYNAGDDFELTPNDKLEMVIGSNYRLPYHIVTCELYVDSILIRKGQIGYLEGFTNEYGGVNRFSLIKLNEIVDDKTISGTCSLEIKIKYYNGDNYAAYGSVLLEQNNQKIFKGYNYDAPRYCGLAKNLSLEDYYCYGKGLDAILSNFNNQLTNAVIIQRSEFSGSFDNSISENYVYYMQPYNSTWQLNIYGFSNNSMIVFNTDPDNDFEYSFSIDSGWRINKPFNFQRGKSYAIACEGNCIFWCEVQNYE